MTTAVLVDSAATLPPDLRDRHQIRVVPLHLMIGDETHLDGSVDLDRVLDRLDDGVSTSSPSPGDFVRAIEAAGDDGADAVLVITVASHMSATFDAARVAAGTTELPVRVLDSGTAAGGEGLVALAGARAALDGAGLDEVEARARKVAGVVELVATIDSLDRLVAGGRLPPIAGWAGRHLNVNPLFAFRSGEIHRLRPAFSRQGALDRIIGDCLGSRPSGSARLHAAVLHARAPEAVRHLEERIATAGDVEWFVGEFSAVMVTHTGPGLAGLAWWWEV